MQKNRQYGLDLLKIIAMIFIIGLHFNYRTGAVSEFSIDDRRFFVTGISEAFFYVSVDCFVLITGYFDIKKKSPNVCRLVSLICAVWFYSITGLLIGLLMGLNISGSQLLTCITPLISGHYWFIDDYLVLCLLIPSINKLVHGNSKRRISFFIAIGLLLFSLVPTVAPWSDTIFSLRGGTDIVWFVVLYCIGGYIKLYDPLERISSKKLIILFFMLCFFCFGVKLVICILSSIFLPGRDIGGGILYHHNSIVILAAAVSLFVVMSRINITPPTGQYVSGIAACTFGVYLGHEHELFRTTFWGTVVSYIPTDPMGWCVCMLGLILLVFVFFAFVERLRQWLFASVGLDRVQLAVSNAIVIKARSFLTDLSFKTDGGALHSANSAGLDDR